MNKAIQGFERVMVSLMMLAVILVCANLYFTMDRRQAQFEAKVTGSLNGLSASVTGVTTAKMDDLTKEVHGQLEPVSKQTTALLTALTGKVNALDVVGLNKGVATTLTAVSKATDGVTAALGNVNETVKQVNVALPDFLDCQIPTEDEAERGWKPGNPGCLYFRFEEIGLGAKAVSAAMPSISTSVSSATATVAKELPNIAASVGGMTSDGHAITTDVHGITTKSLAYLTVLTTPPTRAQKWEAFGKSLVYAAIKYLTW